MPAILIVLSSGSISPNSRSASPQPRMRDRLAAFDFDRAHHPAALGVEGGEVRVARWSRPGSGRCRSPRSGTTPWRCAPACAATDTMSGLNARIASASSSVISGIVASPLGSSSSLKIGGMRWTVKLSAPMSLTMASATIPFMPWMSGDHRDDRRDRHDVAQHRHERSQLVGPDGLQRDQDGVEDLVHLLGVEPVAIAPSLFCCTLTSPPSESSRTESNGPVMTWSPAFRPVEHFEVLLAGDAHLDRREDAHGRRGRRTRLRSPSACGRAAARSTPRPVGLDAFAAPAPRRLFADQLVLVVVEHLPHGQRLDRHRDDVLARRGRDLRRAGEAGTDVRHLLVERDHHFEGRRLALAAVFCVAV